MPKWSGAVLGSTGATLTLTISSLAGQMLVLQGLCASIIANSQVNTIGSTYRTLAVHDGSTTGPILWQTRVHLPASSGWGVYGTFESLSVVGTTGSRMTIQFVTAATTNTLYSLAADGVSH